jgi:hypothetical protein
MLLLRGRFNKGGLLERLNVLSAVADGTAHLHEAWPLSLVPPRPHGERRDAKALGNFCVREDPIIDARKNLFGIHGGHSFSCSTEVPDRFKGPSSV